MKMQRRPWACVAAYALLVAGCRATQQEQTEQQTDRFDYFSGNTKYLYEDVREYYNNLSLSLGRPAAICTSEWTPMVYCAGLDPGQETGFFASVFMETAYLMGFEQNHFVSNCTTWDNMIARALTGDCDIITGGLEIASKHLDAGLDFSTPVYRTGYRILVSAKEASPDPWAFIKAFDLSLWMAVLATVFVTGLLLHAAEVYSLKRNTSFAQPGVHGILDLQWKSWGMMGYVTELAPEAISTRILVVAYGWVLLIVLAAFTANTAAITALGSGTKVTGLDDLAGMRVGVWDPPGAPDMALQNLLEDYNITNLQRVDWDSEAHEKKFIAQLKANEFDAMVIDAAYVEYMVAVDCGLLTTGPVYQSYQLALAFPAYTPGYVIDGWSNAILEGQAMTGLLDRAENHYIREVSTKCSQSLDSDSVHQVTFAAVAGLWVIMGAACGVGLLLMLFQRLTKACIRARAEVRQQARQQRTPAVFRSMDSGNGEPHPFSCRAGVGFPPPAPSPFEGSAPPGDKAEGEEGPGDKAGLGGRGLFPASSSVGGGGFAGSFCSRSRSGGGSARKLLGRRASLSQSLQRVSRTSAKFKSFTRAVAKDVRDGGDDHHRGRSGAEAQGKGSDAGRWAAEEAGAVEGAVPAQGGTRRQSACTAALTVVAGADGGVADLIQRQHPARMHCGTACSGVEAMTPGAIGGLSPSRSGAVSPALPLSPPGSATPIVTTPIVRVRLLVSEDGSVGIGSEAPSSSVSPATATRPRHGT